MPETKTDEVLQTHAAHVLAHGPDRVLIDPDEGVPSRRARAQYGVTPDVIFIRDDGWSLGAPAHLEQAAERLWADHWIGVLRRPATTAEPYRRRP